jgi:cystathionine beta-lyase
MTPSDPFDLSPETLRHPESVKWARHGPDVIPMWVADMDFDIAPSIRAAIVERVSRPIGYHDVDNDEGLIAPLRKKFEAQGIVALPDKGWIHFFTGVVPALYTAVVGLTDPGDEVITMIPIYPPFLSAITDHGRVAKHAALREESPGKWVIDFEALERCVTPRTKMLTLCHPHNPTGRLWTREELSKLADFAERNGLYVVSDELHADLTLDGQFVPFVSIASEAVRAKTLTLTGPCKTYNTAGLGIGAMIAHDPELIKRSLKAVRGIAGRPGTTNVAMWRAALRDDGKWLSAVLDALRDRRAMLVDFARRRLPGVRVTVPEATYLAWLDYRAHPKAADVQKLLLEEAKVAVIPGHVFGPGYEGFVRLNFATSRSILSEALERMTKVGP